MIEVMNVSKRYGGFEAVKNVSFSVGKDQVLGLLGPNGAGKTTIMKILTGYHFPSGGQAKIDGVSVTENPVGAKERIGYLPEGNPLYGDLSPAAYLDFTAAARLIPRTKRRNAVNDALAACGLEGVKNQPIESLSKGYKQRVGLAQAIIHDPPILILDEPTSGLDPNQIIEIRSLIRDLGKRKTVILSTHIMQEVEAVCTRVLILNDGRIIALGTPEEIAETMKGAAQDGMTQGASWGGEDTWELELKGAARADIETRLKSLEREVAGVKAEDSGNGILRLGFQISGGGSPHGSAADGERIFDWAVSQGYKIIGMNRKKLSLEEIFVKLTNERLTNEPAGNGPRASSGEQAE